MKILNRETIAKRKAFNWTPLIWTLGTAAALAVVGTAGCFYVKRSLFTDDFDEIVYDETSHLNEYIKKFNDIPQVPGWQIFHAPVTYEKSDNQFNSKHCAEISDLYGYELKQGNRLGLFLSPELIIGRHEVVFLKKFTLNGSIGFAQSDLFSLEREDETTLTHMANVGGDDLKFFSNDEVKYDFVKFYYTHS